MSESLDTLDERWKAGSFRYLMPDFRARVHRGETFVIAGDRFAIGSSREMSPAGLKAIAEEVGLEMVIICGNNMGDIFRRNSFNLGLHVVQSPEAVADARDGDEFTFDPVSRQIVNVTQGKTYDAGAAQRQGRRDPPERRHLRGRPPRVPRRRSLRQPEDRLSRRATRARTMSTTAQIVWAHRVDKDAEVAPGATLRVYADLLPASDGTAPFSIHTFNQITGGNAIFPRQAAVANDHFVFTGKKDDDKQTAIGAAVRGVPRHREAVLRHARRRHLPFLFPGAGPGAAGAVHSRRRLAQPRLRRLRRGRHGRRLDDARVRVVDRLHLLHDGEGSAASRSAAGCSPWVTGKDIVLELLRRWGAKQSQGMSVELVDADQQLPIAFRNTIANMMAEAEALNGIFAPDEITYAWYRAKGMTDLPYPQFALRRRRAVRDRRGARCSATSRR